MIQQYYLIFKHSLLLKKTKSGYVLELMCVEKFVPKIDALFVPLKV